MPVEILGKNETEEKDRAKNFTFDKIYQLLSKEREKALGILRKIVKYQFWNYVPLTNIGQLSYNNGCNYP